MSTMEVTFYPDPDLYPACEDDEITAELPSKFAVCPKCEGHGTHLREAIASYAYTREEFEEAFPDDESRQAYFKRGGMYDIQYTRCKGQRVVEVVDEAACLTDEQKRALKAYKRSERMKAQWDAEDRATYRMENGGYDG